MTEPRNNATPGTAGTPATPAPASSPTAPGQGPAPGAAPKTPPQPDAFEQQAQKDYDAAQAASDAAGKAPQKPPEAPPAAKPPETPKPGEGQPQPWTPERLQEAHQQLQTYETRLRECAGQLEQYVQDPVFQRALQIAQAEASGQPLPGQGGANAPGPQPPAKDPLESFKPETENETALVGVIRGLQQQLAEKTADLEQRLGDIDGRVGRFDRHYQQSWDRDTNHDIDVALRGNGSGDKGLAAEFPDLVDGGANEDKLQNEASLLMYASIVQRESTKLPDGTYPPDAPAVLTTAESLRKAARILAHDGIAQRERKKVQQEAGRSAGAELPNPAGAVAPGGLGWEEQAQADYEAAERAGT